MESSQAATIIGTAAATCTTIAFVPQIQRILKTGGNDVSYAMLALYLMGVSVWLAYGLVIGALALTIANGLSIVFLSTCIVLKMMKGRAKIDSPSRSSRSSSPMSSHIAP